MAQTITCECGEVFDPGAPPGVEITCPRCYKPISVSRMSGTLGYMGPSTGSAVMTHRAIELLRQTSLWVRIMAVLTFVGAGFMLLGAALLVVVGMAGAGRNEPPGLLGCMYVPFALLYIMPGIFLWRYASSAKAFSISRDEQNLEQAIQAQKSFWKFVAITALVVIGIYVLIIALAIAGAALRP
ncbi:MAG TPA: DUF5362 family protein [Phycisphaerae bacterium]|nr:DUF5362 family protein [Phycisphaerae bacterium]